MTWLKRCVRVLRVACSLLIIVSPAEAATTNELKFDEVFSLIKSNATEISPAELESRAAAALIREFGSRFQLNLGETNNGAQSATNLFPRKAVYNDNYGYLRLASLEEGASAAFLTNYQSLQSSNKTKGLILDLRFSNGQNYAEAAKVADAFLASAKPLLKVGTTNLESTSKSNPIQTPLVVLVNQETAGSPEALAALVRQNELGIIIGNPTAGQARLFEEFTLSTGQKLRIGTTPVELGDGKPLASKVQPDVIVPVSIQDERIYFEDPFKALPRGLSSTNRLASNTLAGLEGTNRTRRLFNEAELVRRHREGTEFDPNAPVGPLPDENRLIITDPALARSVDFLKGLSVLQQFRGSAK